MSTYPADAACAGHRDPTLWDAQVNGETVEHKEWRHHQAKAICRNCPVAYECAQAIDWVWDEGIRAGQLLPEKKNAARSAPPDIKHGTEAGYKAHARRHEPACQPCKDATRVARANRKAATEGALRTCPICRVDTQARNEARHRRMHEREMAS